MISEQENFLRRRKSARRDLFLILLFVVLIVIFLVYWFFFYKDPQRADYQPEIVEIVYEDVSIEREVEEEILPVKRLSRQRTFDSISSLDMKDPRLESDYTSLSEAQRIQSQRIFSEVDVRLKQLELRKKYIRNHFQNFLFTRQNNYIQNENEGITNLYITLNNVSEFFIDLVEIEVQYIDPGIGVVQTKTLFFTGVESKGQLTIKAPNSERGKIVTHFISKINSQSLDFCYSPDKWQKDADDPFKCL
jgi:hypothetical protein